MSKLNSKQYGLKVLVKVKPRVKQTFSIYNVPNETEDPIRIWVLCNPQVSL